MDWAEKNGAQVSKHDGQILHTRNSNEVTVNVDRKGSSGLL